MALHGIAGAPLVRVYPEQADDPPVSGGNASATDPMNRPLTDRRDGRTIHAYEPRAVPWLSVVFGYGPMLPFLAGGALVWLLRGEAGAAIFTLTLLWGCAILLFLSGVRRGVSFRTEGGARSRRSSRCSGCSSSVSPRSWPSPSASSWPPSGS